MLPNPDDRPSENPATEPTGVPPQAAQPPSAASDTVARDEGLAGSGPSEAPGHGSAVSGSEPGISPSGDQKRRRRRRRRHKAPRPAGEQGPNTGNAVAAVLGDAQATPSTDAQPTQEALPQSEAVPGTLSLATPGTAPSGEQPHKRRRRRRRHKGPRPPGTEAASAGGEGQTGENRDVPPPQSGAAPTVASPDRGPRDRGSGNHGPGNHEPGRGPRMRRSREERKPGGDTGSRERAAPEKVARDRGAPSQGNRERGSRGPGKRPFGKGRDAPRQKPQPKLYTFESVVDRGFEDVADEANQEATRRVEWTIVKRTVADQRSATTVSAVYVLKRDGVVTDFANLAAARAAVNKTIVHPEKLTRAKADYASTKK